MKTVWICGLVAGACCSVSAWAVKPGDSRPAVVEELGTPMGDIRRGDDEILYFERGTVQQREDQQMGQRGCTTHRDEPQAGAAEAVRRGARRLGFHR